MSQSSVAVPIPTQMSDAERAVRIDLAACYRLVALYGWDDLVFTHISARLPGPDHHFLINPYGMMFEEITASSLVKVDADGNALGNSPYAVNPAGFTIHSAVHEVREDAGCVIHLHTPDGPAVATSSTGLLPLNQTAQLVLPDLAYHDYEGVARLYGAPWEHNALVRFTDRERRRIEILLREETQISEHVLKRRI